MLQSQVIVLLVVGHVWEVYASLKSVSSVPDKLKDIHPSSGTKSKRYFVQQPSVRRGGCIVSVEQSFWDSNFRRRLTDGGIHLHSTN